MSQQCPSGAPAVAQQCLSSAPAVPWSPPETDVACFYCINGQQHQQLARGATYACGYKSFRSEVCNYSTNIKGNLSIHMSSDKHINNTQQLQDNNPILIAAFSQTFTKQERLYDIHKLEILALTSGLASLSRQCLFAIL